MTALLFLALSAHPLHSRPAQPAWHCREGGGSCVAVEPGAKAPYPRSAHRLAYAFFSTPPGGDRTYSAFDDPAVCAQMREYVRFHPELGTKLSACQELTARDLLRKLARGGK